MELRIEITQKNKERVFAVISKLLELEQQPSSLSPGEAERSSQEQASQENQVTQMQDLLSAPPKITNLPAYSLGKCSSPTRPQLVGSWGQFNSFYPVKAACRIVANSIALGREDNLRLDRFVLASLSEFKRRKMERLRGFPSSGKATAAGRYVWHFLTTAYEMGFLTLRTAPGVKDTMPESLSDWEMSFVGISDKGFEFARFDNDVFDHSNNVQVLSGDESSFILNHLKEIDSKGYREFSLLRDVYRFLGEGHDGKDDLRHWFEGNQSFRDYVASWSRKLGPGSEAEGSKQLSNVASTYAASKIALLRELRLVDYRRNRYDIVGELA